MPSLSETDRQSLLHLARLAVTKLVSRGRILAVGPDSGILSQKRGVFVSLHVGSRLRGCIGVVDPRESLAHTVVHCAIGAAMYDPRFPPLRHDELRRLQIELSLLSTPFVVRPEEIEIGVHGVLVCQGSQRGLLLPQVAIKHRLSAEQFLAEACSKAQLAIDAWRHPESNVFAFTCEVVASGAVRDAETPSAILPEALKEKPAEP
jgi:AmmeMemoRadiSam system protein A